MRQNRKWLKAIPKDAGENAKVTASPRSQSKYDPRPTKNGTEKERLNPENEASKKSSATVTKAEPRRDKKIASRFCGLDRVTSIAPNQLRIDQKKISRNHPKNKNNVLEHQPEPSYKHKQK